MRRRPKPRKWRRPRLRREGRRNSPDQWMRNFIRAAERKILEDLPLPDWEETFEAIARARSPADPEA